MPYSTVSCSPNPIAIWAGINTVTCTNTAQGKLEICKFVTDEISGVLANREFRFTVSGGVGTVRVRANRCSPPILVVPGTYTVTETADNPMGGMQDFELDTSHASGGIAVTPATAELNRNTLARSVTVAMPWAGRPATRCALTSTTASAAGRSRSASTSPPAPPTRWVARRSGSRSGRRILGRLARSPSARSAPKSARSDHQRCGGQHPDPARERRSDNRRRRGDGHHPPAGSSRRTTRGRLRRRSASTTSATCRCRAAVAATRRTAAAAAYSPTGRTASCSRRSWVRRRRTCAGTSAQTPTRSTSPTRPETLEPRSEGMTQ